MDVHIDSVSNPKWQKNVDFSNPNIKSLHAALKLRLWPSLHYTTAQQIQLVSFCGPAMHTECNCMT